MSTESTRLRRPSERLPVPPVIEVSHREIADAWMKNLNVNLETLYRKLPSMDESARRSWQQEVAGHPFELSEQDQLSFFDQVVDARRLSDEELAVMKRTLLLDLAEHRLPSYAETVLKDPRAYALQMLDEARSFSEGSTTMIRDQVRQSVDDAARATADAQQKAVEKGESVSLRSKQEWNHLASDVRAAVVPEVTMLAMISKEEKRRAGEQDPRAFGPEQVQWLRENPTMLLMQTRDVDPDVATIATVIEKASLPPKEATYVLEWLRQAGDPPTAEAMAQAIDRTYPQQPDLAIQKHAALERTLQLIEGYPSSMLTPADIGLPQSLERRGRALRMLVQLRTAMQDDLAIKPDMNTDRRSHDRAYDREMSAMEHALEVYDKQTLPRLLVRVLSEYDRFANSQSAEQQIQVAWRMAMALGERTAELGNAPEATQRIMKFLETAHRTWHGDGQRISAFLDTLRPEIINLVQARADETMLAEQIEEASLALAKTRDESESRRQREDLESLRSRQQQVRRLLDRYANRFSGEA